jgi:flagellar hook-basal body complex protein FliE
MITDPLAGIGAAGRTAADAATRLSGAGAAQAAAATEQGTDFAAMLGEAIAGVAQQLRKAEAVSVAGVKGMASTQDVVEQVMAAEQTLQASIAVRDKIVAAYLEISRMQI